MAQTVDNVLGETVNYTYDYLHRLTAATATNGSWGESYGYDGFGNLMSKTPTQGSAPAYQGATSQPNATGGALIGPAGTWDVENRLSVSFNGVGSYAYDPWGRRVWTQFYDSSYGTSFEAYFFGATGQKLESYNCTILANGELSCALEGTNTYFAGRMISEKGVYVVTDRLGSVRGDSTATNFAYFPWGEERGATAHTGRTLFAGYYRDAVGQDYANYRYYNATSGSFWSPDPAGQGAGGAYAADASYTPGIGVARLNNPLSWNRYLYSLGDPINFFDPIGADSCNADDDECDDSDPDCGDALDPCSADGDEDGGGGGGCPVDTCVTVAASPIVIQPLTFPITETLSQIISTVVDFFTESAGVFGSTALGAVTLLLTPNTTGSTDTLHTSSGVPTPQELQGACTLIDTITVPSTNKRNKGGTSVEEVYQCPDGSIWTVHTLKDPNGGTFDPPQVRPGGSKYGGKKHP